MDMYLLDNHEIGRIQLTQGFDDGFCCSSSLDDEEDDDDDNEQFEGIIKSLLLFVAIEFRFDLIDGDEFES